MAVVQLRNVDDALLRRVKLAAERRNASVEEEIVETLRARFLAEREELARRADSIAALTPKVEQSNSTSLIREDRDR
jgi:plasmid stability protein